MVATTEANEHSERRSRSRDQEANKRKQWKKERRRIEGKKVSARGRRLRTNSERTARSSEDRAAPRPAATETATEQSLQPKTGSDKHVDYFGRSKTEAVGKTYTQGVQPETRKPGGPSQSRYMAQELEERVDDGQKAGVDNRSSSELTWPTLEPEAHSRKAEAANRKQRTTEESGEIVSGHAHLAAWTCTPW